jgi:transmembrane sensor
MRESAQMIDAAASDWAVRIDRGLTRKETIALEEWLAGDTRRAGALARNEAGWMHAERGQAFLGASELRNPRMARRSTFVRPWLAAAAGFLITIAFWAWYAHSTTHFATAAGEVRRVPLRDGSQVTLGKQTRIAVAYEPSTRRVRLESGEALFEVAKDPSRPFVVEGGNVRIRAIGTAFLVNRRPDGAVEVTVTKGIVDVWRETTSPEPATRLAAGKRTLVTAREIAQPRQLTDAQLAQAAELDTSAIELEGRTLGEAAREFNLVNHTIVVINDVQLANHRLIGRLEARNPKAFVQAAAAMFDAHVRTEGDQLILEPGPAPEK